MKKTKILTVLGVLLAMGITACGGNKTSSKSEEKSSQSSQPASSVAPTPASSSSQPASTPDTSAPEQGSSSSSSAVAHVHVWNLPNKDELEEEYAEVDQQPTCTAAGQKTWYCECGETKTEAIKKLGHDFGEWTVKTAATCEQDGVEERECSRCDEKEEQVIKAAHTWGEAQTVAAGAENQVSYKLQTCSVCGAYKATIKATDCSFVKGSIKSGTPSGYFKLNSKNDKAIWRFNVDLPEGKLLEGRMYQIGAMDSYSTNTDKSYASTSTSGDNAPEYTKGNFDVVVNGQSLDKTEWIRITFEEFLKDGEDSSAMGSDYSPLCLCPIGDCYLVRGANEMTYERLGSYNLIISDLVFIGKVITHEHEAATTWSSDENQHWHACTVPGCPTAGKADTPAAHTFGEQYDVVAATCTAKGSYKQKCSVCDYVKTVETDKIAHTYGEAYDVVAATCETAGSQKRKCSVCDDVKEEVLPKLDHTFGDAVENYAAVTEGENQHIAATAHNCSVCGKSALRWNARSFDAAASDTGLDLTHDGDKSVRFSSGNVENKCSTSGNSYSGYTYTLPTAPSTGSHIVYKVNVAEAQENVGLAFKIKNTGGASNKAPVFGLITNDSSWGCYQNPDGSFTQAEHRYGLKVNGVEYKLGEDNYGDQVSVTDWFEWPVQFPVVAGVNTIDVFAYAGYRADIYEFELTGLPNVEPSHIHNGGDAWVTDENNHWHVCTAEGCPIADGKYDSGAHTFGEVNVTTPATHAAAGAGTKTCATCGKVVDVVIPKVAHEWAEGTAVTNTDSKNVIPLTCSCGKVGAKMSENDYSSSEFSTGDDAADALRPKQNSPIVYKIVVAKAGNYSLEFGMFCKSNGGVVMSERGFSVQVNGEAATVTLDGTKTPDGLGMTATNAVQIELCSSVALLEGENTIAITCAGYRLYYKGNLVVAEL